MKGGLTRAPAARVLKNSNAARHHKSISVRAGCCAPSLQLPCIQQRPGKTSSAHPSLSVPDRPGDVDEPLGLFLK
jgi:hypothetical protein